MSGHHCWKWCRPKDISKCCLNDSPFQLWDSVIQFFRTGSRTQPWSRKLAFAPLWWCTRVTKLLISLVDYYLDAVSCVSPTCPCPHPWRAYSSFRKGSGETHSSLVILLWQKRPSAHKILPVWPTLILSLRKARNCLRAWNIQTNLVTTVLMIISFPFGLAAGSTKFQHEFQKPVGGADQKAVESTRTLMRNWKCAELKLMYAQGPSSMQAWKKYIHTVMNNPPQKK